MLYCSLLKNGASVCATVDYWTFPVIFKICSTHTNTVQQHWVSSAPCPPPVNSELMTIELAARCPLFTGCQGSTEEAVHRWINGARASLRLMRAAKHAGSSTARLLTWKHKIVYGLSKQPYFSFECVWFSHAAVATLNLHDLFKSVEMCSMLWFADRTLW